MQKRGARRPVFYSVRYQTHLISSVCSIMDVVHPCCGSGSHNADLSLGLAPFFSVKKSSHVPLFLTPRCDAQPALSLLFCPVSWAAAVCSVCMLRACSRVCVGHTHLRLLHAQSRTHFSCDGGPAAWAEGCYGWLTLNAGTL